MLKDNATTESVSARYSGIAIALHWIIFILIVCGFSLAFYMVGLRMSPDKLKYFAWHKWIGVTVFMLAVLRLGWRLTHRAPPMPPAMPRWQHKCAEASHGLLYLLILVIPVTGWLYSSASGVPTVYLRLVQLPDLVDRNPVLAEQLKNLHISLNYMMLALVIVHAAAAIKHYLIDRDDVLSRMLPIIKPRGE